MRLLGYIRVSRVGGREGESFISPDVQREQIENYAKAHGHQVTDWYTDLDESGAKTSRPQLDKALDRIARGQADGLIAAKLDRLSRSLSFLGTLIERARSEGWNLIAVDFGLDFKTPNGKLVAQVLGAVAEWYLDNTREGWNTARERAVSRGVHVASRTPTGYRRKDDKRLEPDPVAAPVLAELFQRRAAGAGWTELATFLNDSGIVGPYGNARWTHGAVQTLIRNRTYLGEARSGQFFNPDAHESLVSEQVWLAANRKMTPRAPSTRKGEAQLLTGLVRCYGCRYLLKADHMKGRNGSRLGLYRCRKHQAAGTCEECANVLARVLEPEVERQVLAALGPGGILAEVEAFAAIAEAHDAQTRLTEAREQLEAFLAVNEALMTAAPDIYKRKLSEKTDALEAAEHDMAQAEQLSGLPNLIQEGELRLDWTELTVDEKRQLLRALIDCVVVRKGRTPISERVTILWRGQSPPDMPRRGRRVPLRGFAPDELRVSVAEDVHDRTAELVAG